MINYIRLKDCDFNALLENIKFLGFAALLFANCARDETC